MGIGEKIKILRIKKGLSVKELGNKLGVSAVDVLRYEKGKILPSHEELILLSEILSIEYDALIDTDIEIDREQTITNSPKVSDNSFTRETILSKSVESNIGETVDLTPHINELIEKGIKDSKYDIRVESKALEGKLIIAITVIFIQVKK